MNTTTVAEPVTELEGFIERAGYLLRDATLDEVEHFFAYHADVYAEVFLGSPIQTTA